MRTSAIVMACAALGMASPLESIDSVRSQFVSPVAPSSMLEWDSDANGIVSSYRSESIDYISAGAEERSTLGCNKPDCLIAAKVEGPLPTRLAPRADRSYKSRPFIISREDGKQWDKRDGDASPMQFKQATSLMEVGSKYSNYFEPEEVASSYRGEYISYNDLGEKKTSMGCNKPSCLIAAKVEGPLPTRLAPRADRSYKSRPFIISREDGKQWDKRDGDASPMQ